MKQKTICIFLLILLNLMLFFVGGCDFAPALIQQSEESTLLIKEQSKATSEDISREKSNTEEKKTIYIHVCGQVKEPGLYELPAGSRADAAVRAAGGMKKEADERQVNLAQILQDGTQLYIPSSEESVGTESQSTLDDGTAKGETTGSQVNINTASVEQLMTLSGIGESKAKAIVEYRETTGLFSTIEEIKKVSGIGEGIYEKIKEGITV